MRLCEHALRYSSLRVAHLLALSNIRMILVHTVCRLLSIFAARINLQAVAWEQRRLLEFGRLLERKWFCFPTVDITLVEKSVSQPASQLASQPASQPASRAAYLCSCIARWAYIGVTKFDLMRAY